MEHPSSPLSRSTASTAKRPRTPKILVVGSLNMDYCWSVPKLPQPGETTTSTSFHMYPGGKGRNQAMAAAIVSQYRVEGKVVPYPSTEPVEVEMVGCIGKDAVGTELISAMEAVGIDTSRIITDPEIDTGKANIYVDNAGENTIVLLKGANYKLKAACIENVMSLSLPGLLLLQCEIPVETVLYLIEKAKNQGVTVILNAAPVVPHIPTKIFKFIDHLLVNRVEAEDLNQGSKFEQQQMASANTVDKATLKVHYLSVCESLLIRGAKNVVITLGADGGVAGTQTTGGKRQCTTFDAEPGKEGVVDTTGCGDTFTGAYAVEVIRQRDHRSFNMFRAVAWASKAAGISVGHFGATSGIPWGDELGLPDE
ncbi:ribokinase [Penicillium odoratum]|uniref:ribokinase n=1 Tax=Penicillium odoratum TaxID=1167516 RepID=UPI002549602A|nr:ribokinase [Penicillium odoratum]KAJ5771842.1 ribokinase [Penicillium odoratum]